MSYSRVDKFVFEAAARDGSLREASDRRAVDVDVLVGSDRPLATLVPLAASATALILRCISGVVRVHVAANQDDVAARAYAEAQAYGEPERVVLVKSNEPIQGASLGLSTEAEFIADASGWIASINEFAPTKDPALPPASVFATCCAVAKLFTKRVLGWDGHSAEKWSLSMANLGIPNGSVMPVARSDLYLGRIGLLGAGAIGSGFAYVLSLSQWAGELEILDRDNYDEPNHETTLLVGRSDVLRRRAKAKSLAEFARRPGLATNGRKVEVVVDAPELQERWDVFIAAVDNPETRRLLDRTNTEALLNAGVGGTKNDAGHIVCSRHLAGERPLSGLYAADDEPALELTSAMRPAEVRDDQCSRLAYDSVSLAAPFLGLSAGALLAASCAQRVLRAWPPPNYLKLDLLRLQSRFRSEKQIGSNGA